MSAGNLFNFFRSNLLIFFYINGYWPKDFIKRNEKLVGGKLGHLLQKENQFSLKKITQGKSGRQNFDFEPIHEWPNAFQFYPDSTSNSAWRNAIHKQKIMKSLW